MTPNRSSRILEIFQAALDCDPPARGALLDRLCADDAGLRAEVEKLLTDDERAARDQFLKPPELVKRDAGGARLSPIPLHGLEVHIQCPHCRNPIELVGLPVADVLCPSCGSTFRLEGGSTATWSPRQGQRQLGRFELIEAVGVGAFGTVYKARDSKLDRVVAIKVPRAGNLSTAEERDRFLREARSVAQLRHPGIVPVHEVGEHEGLPHLVSDFVQGLTLSDYLTGRRPTPREAARLVAEVADAIQFAHEHGVIHRDIKPSNILLDDAGRPHVMDFGLAKREAGEVTMTIEGQVLGTPAYMCPEQAGGEGHRVDGRGDVYSLGVVLYELLTGELPFRGNTRMLLHQVLHDEPRSPRSLNDRIPRDLETICLKAIAKAPSRRYATAGELADDLGRWQAGEPIRARPVGPVGRSWRWCRRNPLVASLTTTVAASLITGTVVASYFAVRATRGEKAAELNLTRAKEARSISDMLAVRANRGEKAAELNLTRTKEAKLLSDTHRYFAEMNLAQRDWQDSKIANVIGRLEDQIPKQADEPDLRGFEWYHLQRLCHLDLRTFNWHSSIESMAFSSDGRRIASAGWDRTVKVWDAATGREALTYRGHSDHVMSVAFSPDGLRIASAGDDGTVRIWDAATGREALIICGHASSVKSVKSVAFSPDGRRIASAGWDRTVKVWDAATGREALTLRGHTSSVESVAFSPDGRRIASASWDDTVKVWDATDGREALTFRGHTSSVTSVAFSPDGRRIASAGWDRTVKVWDAATGREALTLRGHSDHVRSVAFSPDGRRIASAGWDRTVKVWDAATGREALTFRGHASSVTSVAFSPDGRRIASTAEWDGGWDRPVKVWDAVTGRETLTFRGHIREVRSVVFSPDGRRIASAGDDDEVKVWDATTGREALTLQGHSDHVTSVAFSPDGRRIASAGRDGTVRIWDAATGREALTLRRHTGKNVYSFISTNVIFSPDGRRIASAGDDDEVKVWDTATGREVLIIRGHTVKVTSVAFSPDGRRIASAGDDGTVRIWDAATGREALTLQGHTSSVTSVAFSPDGRRIASASADTVMIWDSDPMTPRTRTQYDALQFLRSLLQRGASLAEIRDRISDDETTSREARAMALTLAEGMWEAWIRDQARDMVATLFDRLLIRADVIDSLRADLANDPDVLSVALAMAETWAEPEPDVKNGAAWKLVSQPNHPEDDYRRGLRLAQDACRLKHNNGFYLNTLGVAQYRLGEYEKAQATLTRSNQLNENRRPADLVFLVMVRDRLGQVESARATFERLRELMRAPEIASVEENQDMLREAESLMGGAIELPANVFAP